MDIIDLEYTIFNSVTFQFRERDGFREWIYIRNMYRRSWQSRGIRKIVACRAIRDTEGRKDNTHTPRETDWPGTRFSSLPPFIQTPGVVSRVRGNFVAKLPSAPLSVRFYGNLKINPSAGLAGKRTSLLQSDSASNFRLLWLEEQTKIHEESCFDIFRKVI